MTDANVLSRLGETLAARKGADFQVGSRTEKHAHASEPGCLVDFR